MKKFLRIILMGILISNILTPVSALNENENDELLSLTAEVLQSIQADPYNHQMDDLNYANLDLGMEIPAYECIDSNLKRIIDLKYYPILENGFWRATAIASYEGDMLTSVQISKLFVEKTSNIDSSSNLALIFDNIHGYLINDGVVHILSTYENNAQRSSFANIPGLFSTTSDMETTRLQPRAAIPYISVYGIPDQKYIAVNKVRQEAIKNCWATCIKVVGDYYGDSKTLSQIYSSAGRGEDDGGSNQHVENVFINLYGYTTDFQAVVYFDTLRSNIYSEHLMVGEVGEFNAPKHAVVVRGYYKYNYSTTHIGSLSYMDPLAADYLAAGFTTDGNYPYINGAGANGGKFHSFVTAY